MNCADIGKFWYRSVCTALTAAGVECVLRAMPDPVQAHMSNWLPFMEKELQIDAHTICIGHSTGAVAALRYAETHQVHAIVLLAGYDNDLQSPHERASGYFESPFRYSAIAANTRVQHVFLGVDDLFVPIREQRGMLQRLKTYSSRVVPHEFPKAGHFMMRSLPELTAVILETIKAHNSADQAASGAETSTGAAMPADGVASSKLPNGAVSYTTSIPVASEDSLASMARKSEESAAAGNGS
jgi:hypothetical protein